MILFEKVFGITVLYLKYEEKPVALIAFQTIKLTEYLWL